MDDCCRLPYRSFYENGNKKEISNGIPYQEGKVILYYEDGKKKMYSNMRKSMRNGKIKEFNEDGKCIVRAKVRNNKIRGIYFIKGGKWSFSFMVRRQLKKQEKQKSSKSSKV